MSFNAQKTATWPVNSTNVDIDSPDGLEFWTKRFRVSAGMLKAAVRSVGPRFGDVASFLLGKRQC
jgi:hypothetical protein